MFPRVSTFYFGLVFGSLTYDACAPLEAFWVATVYWGTFCCSCCSSCSALAACNCWFMVSFFCPIPAPGTVADFDLWCYWFAYAGVPVLFLALDVIWFTWLLITFLIYFFFMLTWIFTCLLNFCCCKRLRLLITSSLGSKMIVATSPPKPLTMWTTPPPTKSTNPRFLSHPLPHTQEALTG